MKELTEHDTWRLTILWMEPLLKLLQESCVFLKGKGISGARLDSELIFAHVFGCSRLELYLRYDFPVDAATQDVVRPLVVRRGRREPLYYILGSAPFMDLELKVNSQVLIPRPETEELAEQVFRILESDPATILDLGTGSGALALALASRFAGAHVTAVDRSREALEVAAENALRCGFSDRLTFHCGSWFEGLEHRRFDLILANPPYLSESEWGQTEPEVKLFEPREALVSGQDGLDDLKHILTRAVDHLNSGAMVALETSPRHHPELTALAPCTGYGWVRSICDLAGKPRFFFARA